MKGLCDVSRVGVVLLCGGSVVEQTFSRGPFSPPQIDYYDSAVLLEALSRT